MEKFDVVVVGAGFAGITAARDIAQQGHSVLVVEARDRIGGRTYTDDGIGRPVELGGAYVHWSQGHLRREMERHGVSYSYPLPIEHVHWFADGSLHTGSESDHDAVLGPILEAFLADSRDQFPLPYDHSANDISVVDKVTFSQRYADLGLSAYDRDVLDGVMSYTVADANEQSVAQMLHWNSVYFGNWRALFESGAYWRIEGGTKRVIDAIAAESEAEVRLSAPVDSIEDRGEQVVVTTRAGDQISARRVVVAVPVNTMKDLAITPAIDDAAQRFINAGHPMMNRKMWVRVKGEIAPFYAYAPTGANPITFAMTEYRLDGDSLIVCFCPDATAIDPDDIAGVQAALRAYVPDLEVVSAVGHDWAADEFSQGTWMMMRPGQMSAEAPALRRPHGRIHFAGGDIAALFPGWIEGALESGAQVASTVNELLNRKA